MAKVFITDAGVVSPIGTSIEEVYASLAEARPSVGPIGRFDTSRLRTGVGGEVALEALLARLGVDSVECPFFDEPVLLAENPKLAFALAACAEALGLRDDFLSRREARPSWSAEVALFTTAGLEEIGLEGLWSTLDESTHIARELPPTFLGEVLAHVFGFSSHPSVTMVSACASSTQSIGEAFRAIRSGDLAVCLAGGTDSMLFPFGINAFNSLGALAEGHGPECRLAPFDRSRRGTLLGEGAAYFLLESEDAARRNGHRPLCEVVGYASSLDGYHPVKPHPEGLGAIRALESSLAEAGLAPADVDYVNAHGSGTHHNDIVEAKVVGDVFGTHVDTLRVSSTKPFYGHLLTAGGAVELVSLLFAFDRGMVPPNLNLTTLDERCPLRCVRDGAQACAIEAAVSNSFGLHGQNGVLVLRTAPREGDGYAEA